MPLHSGWKFRQANRNEWHPATVPGVVHTDLMDNGLIEDPYYRLNERALRDHRQRIASGDAQRLPQGQRPRRRDRDGRKRGLHGDTFI